MCQVAFLNCEIIPRPKVKNGVRGSQRVKTGVILRGKICGEVGKKRGEIAREL
jgi:hypothetical protein